MQGEMVRKMDKLLAPIQCCNMGKLSLSFVIPLQSDKSLMVEWYACLICARAAWDWFLLSDGVDGSWYLWLCPNLQDGSSKGPIFDHKTFFPTQRYDMRSANPH